MTVPPESTRPDAEVLRLLARGVEDGIITPQQRDRLAALAPSIAEPRATSVGDDARPRASALSVVTVAYAVGALLVVFACGWFLLDRWARLGPWGVLGVALGYVAVLVLAARGLRRSGFSLAADVATMLVVALAPLVAWPFLSLAGRWPDVVSRDPLLRDTVWMGWQWLVLEGVTMLAALVVLRQRPIVTVTWPLAVALWGSWLHLSQLVRGYDGPLGFERWMMLSGGLFILFVAERVERWQRRAPRRARVAADGSTVGPSVGDVANAFWVTGLITTAIAYLMIWVRADDSPWQHLLPLLSLGLVALSLYVRRRTLLLVGVLGILGYLGFLAEDVFRDYLSFPILLAGFGILVILATVWTQTRFPALVDRLEASRGSDERPFPWSPPMAALPLFVALVMAVVASAEREEARTQAAFLARLTLLRQHSGSTPVASRTGVDRPPRRPPAGPTTGDSARNLPGQAS